jgi:hypothetical protein
MKIRQSPVRLAAPRLSHLKEKATSREPLQHNLTICGCWRAAVAHQQISIKPTTTQRNMYVHLYMLLAITVQTVRIQKNITYLVLAAKKHRLKRL